MRLSVLALILALAVVGCYGQGTRNTYDFIVVGAGTAGSVVTGKLADACSQCNILLIEAGGDATDPTIHNSLVQGNLLTDSYAFLRDDQYSFIPEYYNTNFTLHRGKMLGGSFGINAMFVVHGNPFEWDTTAADTGDARFTWKNTQKYRKRIPKDFDLYTFGSDQPGAQQYIQAVQGAGYDWDSNVFDGSHGLTAAQQFVRLNQNRPGAIRETSFDNFVKNENYDNVEILTFHRVAKVLFDSNKKAYGVSVINERSGATYTFNVTREVILSAGTFRTPQILKLSGVGPAAELQSFGIPVVSDLPAVGSNLNDHVGIAAYWQSFIAPVAPTLYTLPNLYFFAPEQTGKVSFQSEISRTLTSMYPLRLTFNGSVTLASTNPLDKPIIKYHIPQVYEDSIVWYMQNVLFPIITNLRSEGVLGVARTAIDTTADEATLRDYIRHNFETNFHPVSTARVGALNDPTAALDSHFRVKGVSGLRVIDASAHRYLPSGNINAPTLVMGYLGAATIIDDLNL